MSRFNLPMAGLLSVIQLVVTLLITLAQNRVKNPRFGKAALSTEQKTRQRPTNKRQTVFVVLMCILLIIVFISPILSLVSRSLVTFEAARGQRDLPHLVDRWRQERRRRGLGPALAWVGRVLRSAFSRR